ncbi:MAG TPA: dUTP diphosphatase [Gaiellaceae bacterium]|nr:dUTP diphosphatase [Gaiellaceae bacterium]
MIELEILRVREGARVPDRAYAGDAGVDLATCEPVSLAPGERALVPTGIAVAIPEGYAGFVQPRSGLAARHGLAVVNSPGLIDSGYRGEIQVVLLNTDREQTFSAEAGERIAQLVVLPVPELTVREVDALRETERGVRGFGSSRAV